MLERGSTLLTTDLRTTLDILIAPDEAFNRIKIFPRAGNAALLVAILAAVGTLIAIPAIEHAALIHLQTSSRFHELDEAQQTSALALVRLVARINWVLAIISTFVAISVTTLTFAVASRLTRASLSVRRSAALASNIAIITFGIGSLMTGLVTVLRGPNAFSRPLDIYLAVPSVAWLVGGVANPIAGLLGAINPFNIWSLILLARGSLVVGGLPIWAGYVAGIFVVGLNAIFYAWSIGK